MIGLHTANVARHTPFRVCSLAGPHLRGVFPASLVQTTGVLLRRGGHSSGQPVFRELAFRMHQERADRAEH